MALAATQDITGVTRIEQARRTLELRKCENDFAYFVDNFCMMWAKEGGDPIPFHLWEFQQDGAEQMQKEQKLIFLKARQMGLSWLVVAYIVWCVRFKKNFHVYITSIGLREVNEQMERARFIWYNLPEWMRSDISLGGKGCKDNDSLIEFTNGSAIHAIASTRSAGHGAAPGLYILDEFARKENDVMTWRAVKPSLGKNSQVIIISTSNGFGNLYADLWFGATKGDNGFKPVFYKASRHPDYTPEYLAQMKEDFGADVQGFMEAFPETPEEAFQSTSRGVFNHTRIRELKEFVLEKGIKPALGYLDYDDDGKLQFYADGKGSLAIYKKPEKGKHYTCGADVAQGVIGGDYSVAVVLCVETYEVVAVYRAKIPQEAYAYILTMLGTYYRNAFMVVEANRGSEIVMNDIKASYQFLYCRPVRNKLTDLPTLVPGFLTSDTSKPRVIQQLRRALMDNKKPLLVYPMLVLDELAAYEADDRGRMNAPKGMHDDSVIALALAFEGTLTLPYYEDDEDMNGWKLQQDRKLTWRSL